jgi:DNA polymerase-1
VTTKTWDIETTIKTSFKRKANPFDTDNWVVTHGVKPYGQPVQEHRFGRHRPPPGWFKQVLDGCTLLVGMNIKFDLLHALQDAENLEAWMEWIGEKNGRVWDIQLAEYLLCGMEQASHMLSLDELAVRYNGDLKFDEIKLLWEAGVSTEDIEPALLTRYLCGGVDEHGAYQMGDVDNTEKIALTQIAKAKHAGQLASIMLNMGALVCTVEIERNGMYVNKAKGLEVAARLEVELDKLTKGLAEYLPADLPFDFKWTSRFHKSALFFGGAVKYEKREYLLAKDYGTFKAGEYVFDDAFEKPEDKAEHIAYAQKDEVVYTGEVYKSGKNAGEPKTKKVKVDDLTKPKSRMGKDVYLFKGYTEPEKRWESSDPGVYSTASEVVEELAARGVPFLKAFAELQKLAKDLGTYYIRTDEDGEQTGMLTLVDALGIIHHKLNMCSTVTARLSSSDPNLQNIPKGNKSEVKELFESRFGGVVIQSDFSSLEVYIQAILTNCQQLIADLKAGLDLHCVRLAAKEGMSYEEVLKLAKGYKLPDGTKVEPDKEWDYKRTGAKVYSFQRAFGAGYAKIAASTGMHIDEVQALAEAEDKRYPEIPAYYDLVTVAIQENRVSTGRVIPHPEVKGVMCHLGKSWFRTPDGKLYSYQEHPAPEFVVNPKRGQGRACSFSPTEIRNYVVQGSGGEWAKAAMWVAVRLFYKYRNLGGLALLVNQVHDAMYADADDSVKAQAAAMLHACMEAANDYMECVFNWTIPVPVPSDTTWGKNMMEENSIDGIRESSRKYRTEIRALYLKGYVPSYERQA